MKNPSEVLLVGSANGDPLYDHEGRFFPIRSNNQGALSVELVEPTGAFGELLTASDITPVFQGDFVYTVNTEIWQKIEMGSSTVTNSNNMAVITAGASTSTLASLRSKHAIRYRAGQGARCRWTAIYNAAAVADPAGASITTGVGTAESFLGFGYIGGYGFGIIHNWYGNIREIQTLTVSVASSNVQTAVVTLGGVAFNVPVTAGSTTATAYEIASYDYSQTWPGWKATATGSTVVFVASQGGNQSGLFSCTFPTSGTASFVETVAGATGTTSFIPMSSWSKDNCSGSGGASNPSGFALNPAKLNVYQVRFQYLGAGAIDFFVENTATGKFILVHQIEYANENTIPSLRNPGFPFQASARNVTNNTAVGVSVASIMGAVEGKIVRKGVQKSYMATKTGIGTSLTPIFSIRAAQVFNNKVSTAEIVPATLRIANTGNKGAEIYVFEDATLNNTANFSQLSSSTSVARVDTTATTISGGTQKFAVPVGSLNTADANLFEIDGILEAGSVLTIAAKAVSTTTDLTVSLQWWEDQ